MTRLQRVIKFGARVIASRKKSDHISDVLRDLGWLSVTQLHTYHALCLMKRLLTNMEPHSLVRRLVRRRDVRQTQTRQDNNIDLPAIKTEYGRRRFFYRTVDTFNRLPSRVTVSRIGAFKRRLCRHMTGAKCERTWMLWVPADVCEREIACLFLNPLVNVYVIVHHDSRHEKPV